MTGTVLEMIAAILLITGTLLMVVAGIGIIRMPDLYMRMSAATKASTVGAAALLLAAALSFSGLSVKTQVVATIIFLLATAPVGAHVIARAAYRKRTVTLFERTQQDDLQEYYTGVRPEFEDMPENGV